MSIWKVERNTLEIKILVELYIDGSGKADNRYYNKIFRPYAYLNVISSQVRFKSDL